MRLDKTLEIVLSNRIRSVEDAHGFELKYVSGR